MDATLRIGPTSRLTPDELEGLESLVDLLRIEGLDGEIAYRPPTGLGVTWWQVTGIWLGLSVADAATGHVVDAILDKVTARVRAWIRARRDAGTRPQVVTIYGPDGKPLRKVELASKGDEPVVTDPDE